MDKKDGIVFNNIEYYIPPKDEYVLVVFQCVKDCGPNSYGDIFHLKCKLIIENRWIWIDYYSGKEVPDCFVAVAWADFDEFVKFYEIT